jgi:hypothetical protein
MAFTAGGVALGSNPFDQWQAFVGFAEQRNTGIGSDPSTAKIGDHFAPFRPCEFDGRWGTFWHGKTPCEILSKRLNYITITMV